MTKPSTESELAGLETTGSRTEEIGASRLREYAERCQREGRHLATVETTKAGN